MKFVCEKQFTKEGNYTQEDIINFNTVIDNGIKELKKDWGRNYKGVNITEDNKSLTIKIDEQKIDLQNDFYSLYQIKNDITAVLENYCVPYVME